MNKLEVSKKTWEKYSQKLALETKKSGNREMAEIRVRFIPIEPVEQEKKETQKKSTNK
jgi:hypothetical protein